MADDNKLVGRIHAVMVNGDTPTGRSTAIPSICERQLCPSSSISARLVKIGRTVANGGYGGGEGGGGDGGGGSGGGDGGGDGGGGDGGGGDGGGDGGGGDGGGEGGGGLGKKTCPTTFIHEGQM